MYLRICVKQIMGYLRARATSCNLRPQPRQTASFRCIHVTQDDFAFAS